MIGDVFQPNERVLVVDCAIEEFNDTVGTVVARVSTTEQDCPVYRIDMGDGAHLLLCSCYLDRVPPPMGVDWYTKVQWSQCPWRPHMTTLPGDTLRDIRRLLEKRSKKGKQG